MAVTADQLSKLARNLNDRGATKLGIELGFTMKEVQEYSESNTLTGRVRTKGTELMLTDWEENTPKANQRSILIKALQDTQLIGPLEEVFGEQSALAAPGSSGQTPAPSTSSDSTPERRAATRPRQSVQPTVPAGKETDQDEELPLSPYKDRPIPAARPDQRQLDSKANYAMWNSMKKGQAYILCNFKFVQNRDLPGLKQDAANLRELFTSLDFDVRLEYNLKAQRIKDTLREFTQFQDEPNGPQSAVLFLNSHGSQDGILGSDDVEVPIDEIMELFTGLNCPKMKTKPKMIFIDACWGNEKTKPVQPKSGGSSITPKNITNHIPNNADVFLIHATSEGKISLCNENGSWFVQDLCTEFYDNANTDDLDTLLNKVTGRVKDRYANVDEPDGSVVPTTQTPTVLKQGVDRKLYFLPGYELKK